MSSKKSKSVIKTVKYTEKQLQAALMAIKQGQSVYSVAKQFKIPKTTLLYKSKGRLPPQISKRGPVCLLGIEIENDIVEWILDMTKDGCLVTKAQLISSVHMMLDTLDKPTQQFTNNTPGRAWYSAFLSRHPEMSECITQNLTSSRVAVTEEQIRNWFKQTNDYLKSKNLDNIGADRQYNCDEIALSLNPQNDSATENDELITLVCGNASGQVLPPLVMFPYKRLPKAISSSIPNGWGVDNSDDGLITSKTFYNYIEKIFYPWLVLNNIEFPVILFVDGQSANLTYSLSQLCREKRIELVALYQNQVVFQWRMENNANKLKREHFCKLLEKTLLQLDMKIILQDGFRSFGLYPFNADTIDYVKCFKTSNSQKPTRPAIRSTSTSFDQEEIQITLDVLESTMDKKIIKQFEKSKSQGRWSGDVKFEALFQTWLKIKLMVNDELVVKDELPVENIINDYEQPGVYFRLLE
ncbi:uncharacterized protein LOC122857394 isoform X2 [Aphidius gifuensis]|uniref:uncharacterized protein LOC122857394 isoform X2 n=1 Tax=Aphidius gifuensis TaxID=684658 RepID=UPI001CDC21D2|nr:uncharacterized protein LOC122857394 isoform X2 [Aphidius gifuensis]